MIHISLYVSISDLWSIHGGLNRRSKSKSKPLFSALFVQRKRKRSENENAQCLAHWLKRCLAHWLKRKFKFYIWRILLGQIREFSWAGTFVKCSVCDKELAGTQKKADKTAESEKLTAKIEQQAAASAKLKSEIATLEGELAKLVKEQAEMDNIRAEEKPQWETNSAEMEKGLNHVKLALKVLNEYYAKA